DVARERLDQREPGLYDPLRVLRFAGGRNGKSRHPRGWPPWFVERAELETAAPADRWGLSVLAHRTASQPRCWCSKNVPDEQGCGRRTRTNARLERLRRRAGSASAGQA